MKILVSFVICYIVVYLFYLLFVVLNKRGLSKQKDSIEIKYLVSRYKLNLEKHDIKKVSNLLALTNSFIISTTFVIVSFIDKYFFKLLVGFVCLFPLILLLYHILGKYLKKKEGK